MLEFYSLPINKITNTEGVQLIFRNVMFREEKSPTRGTHSKQC